MKKALGSFVFLTLAALYHSEPASAATAHDFFPMCAGPAVATGQTLIVDPSGTQRNSYKNIAVALKAAKPGDKISLMSGEYGAVALDGKNSDFITIEAAPGQTPKFTNIAVGWRGGASRWLIRGLTVSGVSIGQYRNGSFMHTPLADMRNSDNIIFEHNNLFSQQGEFAWQQEIGAPPTLATVSTGIQVDQSSCVSLAQNHIFNVFNAITIGGDQVGDRGKYFAVTDNLIDDFAGDGIDHSASHVRILRNRITNGHDVCQNKCIHTDGIQGWNWHNQAGQVDTDVLIDSNVIIAQTKPNLVLPSDDLHGITIFDGFWDGVQISNNLVITSTWHGITAYGVNNLTVINNTVAGTNAKRRAWIAYNPRKNAPPGTTYQGVIIRNNVALDLPQERSLPGGAVLDHNFRVGSVDDFADNFVKFDPSHFVYDLHPTKRSDARGEGSAEKAPAMDMEGKPRGPKIDIGAYAFPSN
jgi:hypothetical protein